MLIGNINCIKENNEALVSMSTEVDQEIHAEEIKSVFKSFIRIENDNIGVISKFFETVLEFNIWEKGTNQTTFMEKLRPSLNSGHSFYYSVQSRCPHFCSIKM
jgi:hypothetical protein